MSTNSVSNVEAFADGHLEAVLRLALQLEELERRLASVDKFLLLVQSQEGAPFWLFPYLHHNLVLELAYLKVLRAEHCRPKPLPNDRSFGPFVGENFQRVLGLHDTSSADLDLVVPHTLGSLKGPWSQIAAELEPAELLPFLLPAAYQ